MNKPCPGCNHTDVVWVEADPKAHVKLRYQAMCSCGWSAPPRESEEAAWEAWNERRKRQNLSKAKRAL